MKIIARTFMVSNFLFSTAVVTNDQAFSNLKSCKFIFPHVRQSEKPND